MNTHATASKQWTDAEMADLIVENQFRLRGLEVTRMDTFIDAAFAFVLTLLVISFDDIPSNYTEMLAAVKQIPGFAASFATLMMFWLQHRRWSRRYGLENARTIFFSLVLIFVTMVYVYPLRMVFEGMFSNLTNGYLPTSFQLESYTELRTMFVFYSVGFFSLSLLISQLYRAAIRSSDALALNDYELRRTTIDVQVWTIAAGFGFTSIVLALTLPEALITLAGWIYVLFFFAAQLPAYVARRKETSETSADDT